MQRLEPTSRPPRSAPPGFAGPRADILIELKRAQRLTTRQLADRLGCAHNTIRHHLKSLEEQGLVVYEREHRGVGAPTFAYRLTGLGEGLFPRHYQPTLSGLLDHIVARDGRAAAVAMLEARYSKLAQELQDQLAQASTSERLKAVATVLSEDGYMAEATTSDDASSATLTEHNCAILELAERFPEICDAEARFLQQVLGGQVERERHILNGCSACEYRVRFDSSAGTSSAGTARATVSPEPEPSAPTIQENS
jgi:DeoR family suf operon transcriptional repressor